jgi:hypothetical protein
MSQETQVVQTHTFTLTGNVGADPKPHSLPAQTILWTDYDPITEETVEKNDDEPGLRSQMFDLALLIPNRRARTRSSASTLARKDRPLCQH